jgi:hypothetical protein
MNNNHDNIKDPLKDFITPDLCEKAPDGFSEKIMSGITSVTARETVARNKKLISVPAIASLITISLILAAFLVRGTGSTSTFVKILNQALNMLPEIKTGNLFNATLPVITGYVAVGLVILGIFDKFLFRFFNRKKNLHTQI